MMEIEKEINLPIKKPGYLKARAFDDLNLV